MGGMDAKGVLSQADFEAINAGLGKAISSVPTGTVMDVYNSMAKVIGNSPVPNKLYSTVNPRMPRQPTMPCWSLRTLSKRPVELGVISGCAKLLGGLQRVTLDVRARLVLF